MRQEVLQHGLAGHGRWGDRRLRWRTLRCWVDGSLRLSQLRLHSLCSGRWGHWLLLLLWLLRLRLMCSVVRRMTSGCSLIGGLQLELRWIEDVIGA